MVTGGKDGFIRTCQTPRVKAVGHVLSFGSLVRGVDLLNGSYIVGLANGSIFSVYRPVSENADLEIIPEEDG